jgi:hypothetical protein
LKDGQWYDVISITVPNHQGSAWLPHCSSETWCNPCGEGHNASEWFLIAETSGHCQHTSLAHTTKQDAIGRKAMRFRLPKECMDHRHRNVKPWRSHTFGHLALELVKPTTLD